MEKKFTFCRICEATCGFIAEVDENRIVKYYPDKDHPVSKGYCCAKGREMVKKQYHPKRLRHPLKRIGDTYERISWEQAIEEIGEKIVKLNQSLGPHCIGAYVGNVLAFSYSAVIFSGSFFQFLGTRNIYGPGSQDCNNKFAHSQRFYGSPLTIISPDFENIDYFIGLGTNPLASHFTLANFPNPSRRLKDMEKRGCKIVWINPRKTEAAKIAGDHIFIKPNTDIYLLFGMIHYVLENHLQDKDFINTYSKGIDQLRDISRQLGSDLDMISQVTGIEKGDIIKLTGEFAETSRKGAASMYGRVGTDRGPYATLLAWAIDVFNFITGNIDKKGNFYSQGFLNVSKLGDADGGISSEIPKERRSRIGDFEPVMGYLPAATMADEILTPGEGQIKAMIILGGDPLVSCPNTGKLEKAFRNLELSVSIDIFMNDTGIISDYLLPTTTFLEREEFSFVMSAFNQTSFVSFSPAVVNPEDDVKDEWEIFNLLGERIGVPILGDQPLEVLKQLFPGEEQKGLEKLLKSEKGIFLNEEKKARYNVLLPDEIKLPDRLIPLVPEDYIKEFERFKELGLPHDAEYPFSLVSGRQVETINSWIHVRGETNYCFLNPEDAKSLGIDDYDNIRVSTRIGSIDIPARITRDLMKGVVWIPHGWGRTIENVPELAVEKKGVNVNLITDDDWTKLESFGGMVMLDGIQVKLERM